MIKLFEHTHGTKGRTHFTTSHLCVFEVGFVIRRVVISCEAFLIMYGLTIMNFVLVYPTIKKLVIVLHVKLDL